MGETPGMGRPPFKRGSPSLSPDGSQRYLLAPASQLQHLQLVQVLPPAREVPQALLPLLQSLQGV